MNCNDNLDAEEIRLGEDAQRDKNWKRWGPYLAERQWGTVREDYSEDGSNWDYFPHEQARSRAYRWGEDGLLGICDREGRLCFALALWNGCDPILKERIFGLTNSQGNHGEDVKEYYFYLDSTPTHSYFKANYKYPQSEFPYTRLIEENQQRSESESEFELIDTGIFAENRYFDVFAEYAKASPNDILIKITVANRASQTATLDILPTIWFKNTWSWGRTGESYWSKPRIEYKKDGELLLDQETLGKFHLAVEPFLGSEPPKFLFTDNETNAVKLFNAAENPSPYVKDAFHDYIVSGVKDAVNPEMVGTKAAAHYHLEIPAKEEVTIRLRLFAQDEAPQQPFDEDFERIFQQRIDEAEEFYQKRVSCNLSEHENRVVRQAYAGLLWSKQFYHYGVKQWLEGDPAQPPAKREKNGRNVDWTELYNRDIISMPDKWEYPWYASWDLGFQIVAFAKIDPEFAKQQLILFLREWYMHPNGQIPAYEFDFSATNPPVLPWACWRVYKITACKGERDRTFLVRVFQKLLVNFTWWVNRKDSTGKNIFSGGFLGMDNIGVFDRSKPLPTGGNLQQADGTAWMAFYCLTMLAMALELADEDPAYEDIASKFFEHFIAISDAMNRLGGTGLWDEEDGFYYDQLEVDDKYIPLKVRSLVGLVLFFAVETIDFHLIERLPGFSKRMQWFLKNRKDVTQHISCMKKARDHGRMLLAIPSQERLERVLHYLLDETEFLSKYGIRSLSRHHLDHPYILKFDHQEYCVKYLPGESNSNFFGGNSNWRGPIWFPLNYLLIEALERYYHFYGDSLKVECPTNSGQMMNLSQVADELQKRLTQIFLPDEQGRCPWQGNNQYFVDDPHWRDLILYYEYFCGDSGHGLGANHQTGWTALIARLLEDIGCRR
ncbi:glucosidase [Hassallia byssoidea VB512170]|uniref:Glucosidase n=1 Tax=Hassallia byssoidea VB512170 TaxID=1304833 RepID=A0A846H3C0_9CYAN|nr:glucosidase [Hassalia byssoidea]NEU71906.1 glucosidase [Hassalia byssoidea VB512170]